MVGELIGGLLCRGRGDDMVHQGNSGEPKL
jgi:hypothetical protein